MRADAERLEALDLEYQRALGEALHAQQRQTELRVELDALHH